jgi:hypothetical protein
MGFKTIEIDWYLDPLRDVITGVEHGLKQVSARPDEVEWFDGNLVMDHSEWLLGVAFVGTQAYIESAIGDVWRHLHGRSGAKRDASKGFRKKCLSCDAEIKSTGVTRIGLINAAANYYKHHRGPEALRPDTAETLSRAGVNLKDVYAYPCVNVAVLLCGRELRLRVLCDIVRVWRVRVVTEIAGVEPSPIKRRARCRHVAT